ncbi:MAG: peptide deformylase [Candidatus Nanopelagicales bacterium]|nr:peptide deformylase [Candidatus Nanopelagicales bacterium]
MDLPQGRVRPVLAAPAEPLAAPCVTANPADERIVALAADLVATMRQSPGCVGLAANQLGESWRVFSLDVSEHPKAKTHHGEYVLVNPRVVSASRKERAREGCLSVPDFTGDVRRATRLVVWAQLPGSGREIEITTDAFEARAIQHEMDHLDGLLFLDRVAGAHAVHARKTYL